MSLSWFPFYVDDWLGGTSGLLPGEQGAYLSALLAQWQSEELKAIPDNEARLAKICGGPDFTPEVRKKFVKCVIDGRPFLRNRKLAAIWDKQKAEHEAKARGGRTRAQQAGVLLGVHPGELSGVHPGELSGVHPASRARAEEEPRTQNPEQKNPERRAAPESPPDLPVDEKLLAELEANPAYSELNVREVHGKMLAWCQVHGKQPTRRRFINWLNREDKPLSASEQNGTRNRQQTAGERDFEVRRQSEILLSRPKRSKP